MRQKNNNDAKTKNCGPKAHNDWICGQNERGPAIELSSALSTNHLSRFRVIKGRTFLSLRQRFIIWRRSPAVPRDGYNDGAKIFTEMSPRNHLGLRTRQ